MFLSYEPVRYLGFDSKNNVWSYEYKIVDSEFEECSIGGGHMSVGIAVIDVYEKRNLPVIPNLIKALIWHNKKYRIPTGSLIRWTKYYTTNPKYGKYEEQINKYLILL